VWWVDDEQEEQSLMPNLRDQVMREMNKRAIHALPSELTGSGRLLTPRPSCQTQCATVERDAFIWRRPYSMIHKRLEIMAVLIKVPGGPEGISEACLIPLNCRKDGHMPMAMSVTSVWGYWVRCGSYEMMGAAEGLFKVMGNNESLKRYISRHSGPANQS
jgi:hypothetical protein